LFFVCCLPALIVCSTFLAFTHFSQVLFFIYPFFTLLSLCSFFLSFFCFCFCFYVVFVDLFIFLFFSKY
jgi:hypothetical protein